MQDSQLRHLLIGLGLGQFSHRGPAQAGNPRKGPHHQFPIHAVVPEGDPFFPREPFHRLGRELRPGRMR